MTTMAAGPAVAHPMISYKDVKRTCSLSPPDAHKLAATTIVAAGFGGDMDEELANALLDDMDFFNNKVKCRKIELMLPKLEKMVEGEERSFS